MPDVTTAWDVNLRANLRLWPSAAPHVRSLCQAVGQPWDENTFADSYFSGGGADALRRAVRQTFEAMAYEGLVYRSSSDLLVVTRLGEYVLSFLGLLPGCANFGNANNRIIGSAPLILGLSTLVEVRAIWALMRGADNRLTNEELNRAMARVENLDDVLDTIDAVREGRLSGDPTVIGPRLYHDSDFGSPDQSQQRRAMNPYFLLAGGGGLFIDISPVERILIDESLDLIDTALRSYFNPRHASTDAETVIAISQASHAPVNLWRKLNGQYY